MTLVSEKIVVTAKEFLQTKNINDCKEFNDPVFHSKLNDFGWPLQYSVSSVVCEMIWKIALAANNLAVYRRLDRLFSPSPMATYSSFRGSAHYKTGNLPEVGAIAAYRKGNGWQGDMGIVTSVSESKKEFDMIQGKILMGGDDRFITVEEKRNRPVGLLFRPDKYNLIGFIYAPNEEIP